MTSREGGIQKAAVVVIVQRSRVSKGVKRLPCFGSGEVKMCVDSNGRIKLRAKQKCEILSATDSKSDIVYKQNIKEK